MECLYRFWNYGVAIVGSVMIPMPLDLSMTPGVRRFIEYARNQGCEPMHVGMKPGSGATTLVYATGHPVHTYFLVFQRQYEGQRIPRRIIRKIIGGKDLLDAYKKGEMSVQEEMNSGFMTPFVSEGFGDFSVHLDKSSFEGNNGLVFPFGTNGQGFSMPAYVVRDLLIGLYGEEKVHLAGLFDPDRKM